MYVEKYFFPSESLGKSITPKNLQFFCWVPFLNFRIKCIERVGFFKPTKKLLTRW